MLTPTGTSVSDTGLAAATSYSYRVRAVDAAGNLSTYSTVATRHDAGGARYDGADGAGGLTATRGAGRRST